MILKENIKRVDERNGEEEEEEVAAAAAKRTTKVTHIIFKYKVNEALLWHRKKEARERERESLY